jgi:hypothetical protein
MKTLRTLAASALLLVATASFAFAYTDGKDDKDHCKKGASAKGCCSTKKTAMAKKDAGKGSANEAKTASTEVASKDAAKK